MKLLQAGDFEVIDLRKGRNTFKDRAEFRLKNDEGKDVIVKFGPYSWDMGQMNEKMNVAQSSIMLAQPAPGDVVVAHVQLGYAPLEPGSRAPFAYFPASGVIKFEFRMMVYDVEDAHALASPKETFEFCVGLFPPDDGLRYSPLLRMHTRLEVEARPASTGMA